MYKNANKTTRENNYVTLRYTVNNRKLKYLL